MGRRRRRDPAKEELWRSRIARLAASGSPTKHFCRREGISEASLYAWRRELARRDAERPEPAAVARKGGRPAPGVRSGAADAHRLFLPVEIAGPEPSSSAAIEIVLPRARVLVRAGFDHRLLREVVDALCDRADETRP